MQTKFAPVGGSKREAKPSCHDANNLKMEEAVSEAATLSTVIGVSGEYKRGCVAGESTAQGLGNRFGRWRQRQVSTMRLTVGVGT